MSKMRPLLTVALFSLTASMGLTGAATAGSYNGVCESSNGGEVCLYDRADHTGPVYDTLYSKPEYTGTYYGTNTSINNSVSSHWNRDPDTEVWFFTAANYTGGAMGTLPGRKASDEFLGFNNSWSSHCFVSNPACPR
ncbi:peptidase inhibitor family I36 protein [Streptomyces cinereoruber]|uniref:peptidase inhibitor family I36 protein n=1 Tax=Streptomyces cinereoruber TaxID=67260 RepID=UPI00367BEB05